MKLTKSKLRKIIKEEIELESLRNAISKIVREMDFKDKESFKKYQSQHKMRSGTKVNIAGKETTAGAASGDKDSERSSISPKFGKKWKSMISKTRKDLTTKASDQQLKNIIDDQDIWSELEDWDIEPGKIPKDPAARAELSNAVWELVFEPMADDPDEFEDMTKSYLSSNKDPEETRDALKSMFAKDAEEYKDDDHWGPIYDKISKTEDWEEMLEIMSWEGWTQYDIMTLSQEMGADKEALDYIEDIPEFNRMERG